MTDGTDRPLKQADGRDLKAYLKPSLTKGPALSDVTTLKPLSGIVQV